jgi:hypothetical protein
MPRAQSLDSLLPSDEPHATFHDAVISTIRVDYLASQLIAQVHIAIGDPGAIDPAARECRRIGELVVDGLNLWVIEAPRDLTTLDPGLWITHDGLISGSPTESGRTLAKALAPTDVGWFLFINNLNAFAYIAGAQAAFHWL